MLWEMPYLLKGNLDEAIREYREELRIHPGDADTHYNLMTALYNQGLLDEAISEYREALRINPENAATHYSLGNVLSDKGFLDEGIGEFRQALWIDPGYASAYYDLGLVLSDKGLTDKAVEALAFIRYAPPHYAERIEKTKMFIEKLKLKESTQNANRQANSSGKQSWVVNDKRRIQNTKDHAGCSVDSKFMQEFKQLKEIIGMI